MTVYTKTMAQALREVYLVEDNMEQMRKAAGGAMQTIKFRDGKLKVDSFTASAIMKVYEAVNSKNKKSMENIINKGTKSQMMKLQSFAMKQIKSEYDPEDKGPLATVDEHSNGTPHKHPHDDEEDEDEIDQQQQQNAQEAAGTVNMKSPVMLDLLRLYNKAMSEKPNSKKQNEYKKEIAKVRKSMGMTEDVSVVVDTEELTEGTWHIAKDMSGLKMMMKKPIKLGNEGDDATEVVSPFIGDDQLYDDLIAAGKKNPRGDARPIIQKAMKRLRIREEVEVDEARQLKDPKKEMMVKSKNSGVIVIDKKDFKKYQKKGYFHVEGVEEGKLPPHLAKFFDKKGNLKPDAEKRVQKGRKAKWKDVTPKGYGPKEEVEIDEGTWHVPETKIDQMALRKTLRKPIKAKDAEKEMSKHIGDDSLYDKFADLAKENPNQDVRPAIRARMKELGIKEEVELDEKENSYTVVHVKKGKEVVKAKSSYEAAKKFAQMKGLKNTSGVDAHLMEEVELDEGTMNDVIVMKKGRVGVSVVANAANVKKMEKKGYKIDGVIEKGSKILHKEPKRIMKAIKGGDKLGIGEASSPKEYYSQLMTEGKMKELHMYIQQGKKPEWIAKKMGLDAKTVDALMKEGLGNIAKAGAKAAWRGAKKVGKAYYDVTPVGMAHRAVKTGVKKVKDVTGRVKQASAKGEEFDPVEEGAAADARRAIGRDPHLGRKKDSADYDVSATDDDVKAASKNIMMQLRKAQTLRGKFDVEFMDRKKHKVPSKVAQAVTARYMALKRPAEKQEFQNKISKSYKDMLKSLDEAINNEGFIFEHKKETILERIDGKLMERKNG